MNFGFRNDEFGVRNAECGVSSSEWLIITILFLFIAYCLLPTASTAAEKWTGVDETVIEKIAKEHGRQAREPFINTDKGDLLLFVFLLAGAIGGFAAGYSWRKLIEPKQKDNNK